jgi:hypothetical protein
VGLVLLDWDDWLPYIGVPALGSGIVIVGAVGLLAERSFAPYAIAGATVLLLFAGIYGAWDLTLWMIKNREKPVATRILGLLLDHGYPSPIGEGRGSRHTEARRLRRHALNRNHSEEIASVGAVAGCNRDTDSIHQRAQSDVNSNYSV